MSSEEKGEQPDDERVTQPTASLSSHHQQRVSDTLTPGKSVRVNDQVHSPGRKRSKGTGSPILRPCFVEGLLPSPQHSVSGASLYAG
jgi:hypothetical protein